MPKFRVHLIRGKYGGEDTNTTFTTLHEARSQLVTMALTAEPGDKLSLEIAHNSTKQAAKPAPKASKKKPAPEADSRTALAIYLAEFGIPMFHFAAKIKRSPSTISRICNGECKPTPDTAHLIVRETRERVTLDDLYRG